MGENVGRRFVVFVGLLDDLELAFGFLWLIVSVWRVLFGGVVFGSGVFDDHVALGVVGRGLVVGRDI